MTVKELDSGNQDLTRPRKTYNLKDPEVLSVCNSQLTVLPEWIWDLKNLKGYKSGYNSEN